MVAWFVPLIHPLLFRCPEANLLVKGGQNPQQDRYYPMELCIVSDNQKVREQFQQKLGLDRRTMVEVCGG
jgi:hypothetical protein